MNQLSEANSYLSQNEWPQIKNDLEYVESIWNWMLVGPFSIIKWFIYSFITFPIYKLYFNGPSLGGWGFWTGRAFEDICHELSKGTVKSEFWVSSPAAQAQCQQMVYNAFQQFLTLCYFIAYTIFFIFMIYSLIRATTTLCSNASQNLYKMIRERSTNQRILSRRTSFKNSPSRNSAKKSPCKISFETSKSPSRKSPQKM